MGQGAIIITGAKDPRKFQRSDESLQIGPFEYIEVAGRSIAERLIERFAAINVDFISVLVAENSSLPFPIFRTEHSQFHVEVVSDMDAAIVRQLDIFLQRGIHQTFIAYASAYTETDLVDLWCFHKESRQTVTPTFDREGPLNLWVVDCEKYQTLDPGANLTRSGQSANSKYFVREYVNRVESPKSLRSLASDILSRRCQTLPAGRQVRPGVWMDAKAQVHRRARIVAPAYIGCESKLSADVLVTRLSSVERECCIDSGTVVEDSSILENTNVGICLDICHSVVSGGQIFNLERNVLVEIADPVVLRSTLDPHKFFSNRSRRRAVPASQHTTAPHSASTGHLVKE